MEVGNILMFKSLILKYYADVLYGLWFSLLASCSHNNEIIHLFKKPDMSFELLCLKFTAWTQRLSLQRVFWRSLNEAEYEAGYIECYSVIMLRSASLTKVEWLKLGQVLNETWIWNRRGGGVKREQGCQLSHEIQDCRIFGKKM